MKAQLHFQIRWYLDNLILAGYDTPTVVNNFLLFFPTCFSLVLIFNFYFFRFRILSLLISAQMIKARAMPRIPSTVVLSPLHQSTIVTNIEKAVEQRTQWQDTNPATRETRKVGKGPVWEGFAPSFGGNAGSALLGKGSRCHRHWEGGAYRNTVISLCCPKEGAVT